MKSIRVLIVEDDATIRTSLFRIFEREGYQVISANRIADAEVYFKTEMNIDLMVLDLFLPDGDGLSLIEKAKQSRPEIEVLAMTGQGTIDLAVQATQKGAFHFISKPYNPEELISLAAKAVSHKNLIKENQTLRSELKQQYKFNNIIGHSDSIKSVLNLVEKVADTESTVLIMGESGTGKELIARAIHYNSSRAKSSFVAINCGAIPAELLESELFGHVKGAFTGAISNRVGRFELADGGTLFLDEIGDLQASLQVKILRALQERRFEPVGSTKTVEVDVRVIAATNINLEEAVRKGKFREDLFYRLNVIPISLPALRERKSDIQLLLNHFMTQFNKSRTKKLTGFTEGAIQHLCSYEWPGNIRELENLVERLSILKGEGEVDVEDLPTKYSQSTHSPEVSSANIPDQGLDFNSAVDAYENSLILRALEKTGWNRNQAAGLLRLNRTTLVEKIKKKGLRPPVSYGVLDESSDLSN